MATNEDPMVRPGVDRPWKLGDDRNENGDLVDNILMDLIDDVQVVERNGQNPAEPTVDELRVKAVLAIVNEFENENTIKFVVREFIKWKRNQNRIAVADGHSAPTIWSGTTDEDIEGLLEGFIETHPFNWFAPVDMVWRTKD